MFGNCVRSLQTVTNGTIDERGMNCTCKHCHLISATMATRANQHSNHRVPVSIRQPCRVNNKAKRCFCLPLLEQNHPGWDVWSARHSATTKMWREYNYWRAQHIFCVADPRLLLSDCVVACLVRPFPGFEQNKSWPWSTLLDLVVPSVTFWWVRDPCLVGYISFYYIIWRHRARPSVINPHLSLPPVNVRI